MTGSELKRLLKKCGCYSLRKGTNHEWWYSPITDGKFYVPRHDSKEMKPGTVNQILKDAGIK